MIVTFLCEYCQNPGRRKLSEFRKAKHHHCSRRCYALHRSETCTKNFWDKIDCHGGPGACWPWTGGKDEDGYGQAIINGRPIKAHRAAWEFTHKKSAAGIYICHTCVANPSCCNPLHLYDGNAKTNAEDRENQGRTARGRTHWRYHSPDGGPHGEQVITSILKDGDIHQIFEFHAQGLFNREIAKIFGVSRTTVGRVLTRKTWKHISLRSPVEHQQVHSCP